MRIALLIEGKTEKAFLPHLRRFLEGYLEFTMPKLDPVPYHGRIPTGDILKREVERLLSDGMRSADAVIALTDVYTGTNEFADAEDAIRKMRAWTGNQPKFHPHVAQYDFEAWLLPFWEDIKKLAGSHRTAPGPHPELINHMHPPSFHLQEAFRTGSNKRGYIKLRDANRILKGKDLSLVICACPQFKAFVNTIIRLCGRPLIS
jgi:hypothetical protein